MPYQYVRDPLTADDPDPVDNAFQTPTEKLIVWPEKGDGSGSVENRTVARASREDDGSEPGRITAQNHFLRFIRT
jgi:hypothetical protein